MKPGETLKIRLTNDFPPNRDMLPSNPSHPHQFNNTNFHFHGAHCSPSGIADNVMRSMAPGKSYDIEITLPADHTPGTYWYHPHHHGSADVQVASGMVRAIAVEGDFADVPEIAQARERVMLLPQDVGPGTCDRTACHSDEALESPTGPRAGVVVAGEPLAMRLPAALPKPPLETIRDSEITGRRTLVFGAPEPQNNVAGHWQEYAFTVDGKIFDPARTDQRVGLGAVGEWAVPNTHRP